MAIRFAGAQRLAFVWGRDPDTHDPQDDDPKAEPRREVAPGWHEPCEADEGASRFVLRSVNVAEYTAAATIDDHDGRTCAMIDAALAEVDGEAPPPAAEMPPALRLSLAALVWRHVNGTLGLHPTEPR